MQIRTRRLEQLALQRLPRTPTALHGHPAYVPGCSLCEHERDELVRRLFGERRR